MKDKPKFPRREALKVAESLKQLIGNLCERIEIAGSLRREKDYVSDIELVYVPKRPPNLLGDPDPDNDFVTSALNQLLTEHVITKRRCMGGGVIWGALNKLALHVPSGIPVDFFATTELNWINSLFVRTGGKRMNLIITMAANKRGYSFEAYGCGFRCLTENLIKVNRSEEDIFRFCGLKYLEPVLRP